MRRTATALVILTLIGLGLAAAGLGTSPAAMAAAPVNPPANIPPSPNFDAACETPAADACINGAVAAITNARAQEGVSPIVLPSGFASMPVEEQILVLLNLERVDRGLPPFAGTTADLDGLAQQGADAGQDPSAAGPYGKNWQSQAIEAQVGSVLTADYDWMYVDGFDPTGSLNTDCTSAAAAACWGHRDSILHNFGSLPTLILGAATASPAGANPTFAALEIGSDEAQPPLRYSWASIAGSSSTTKVTPPTTPASTTTTLLTGCSAAAPSPSTIQRLAGSSRDQTAIFISHLGFPQPTSAQAVVLASNANFPDALTGGPLSVQRSGPLLITGPTTLDPDVLAEIHRVLPAGGPVYVLGGTFALKPAIDAALTSAGYEVHRVAGADRFATAVAVADLLGDPSTVFEANGLNFPDALAAVPAAVTTQGAILLTNGSTQGVSTSSYTAAHNGTRYAVGGPASTADPGATSLSGADRYATAVLVAQKFFSSPKTIAFATGAAFPDALAGGAYIGTNGGPLLLVPKCPPVQSPVTSYVSTASGSVKTATLFGGTFAVSDATLADLDAAL